MLRVMVMWAGLYSHKEGPVRERAKKPECSPQSIANEASQLLQQELYLELYCYRKILVISVAYRYTEFLAIRTAFLFT